LQLSSSSSSSSRTQQQHAAASSHRVEDGRVPEGQLHQLADFGQLPRAAAHVVVTQFIRALVVFGAQWLLNELELRAVVH
jgi:hypothetical protein